MRKVLPSFALLLVIGACSSRNSYFVTDGGGDGATTSVTGGDGGKKKDTGTEEEETDDAGRTDAKKDTSLPEPSGCEPGDVSSFSPTWKTPAPLHASSCTATQVDTLMCQFDSSADPTACSAAVKDAANATCLKCMFTASSAAQLGPIVITGNLGSLNLAGCIARTENNVTSSGCGAKVAAAEQCGDEACEANCPIDENDNGETLEARNACTEAAATSVCQTYATDAECAETLLTGASSACNVGSDFLTRATAIAKLFCVP